MTDRGECRMPTCSEPARDRAGYAGRTVVRSATSPSKRTARDAAVDEAADQY